ncbi:hypothetical protein ACFE04_016301 [Oxalis oulophora]
MEEKLETSKPKPFPLHHQDSEAEPDETTRFTTSLKELKNLRSQLHYAADYCEGTFLSSKQKKLVVENTKEYICKAFVTVVDHLGNVSANLDHSISGTGSFSVNAEIRIENLKQRLQSCQLYAHKVAMSRYRRPANLPKHHRRYFSMPNSVLETSKDNSRDDEIIPTTPKITEKNEFDAEDVPLFLYTFAHKSCSKRENSNRTSVLPVRDSSVMSRGLSTPIFDFQVGSPRHKRNKFMRKTLQSKEIISLIRRTKRASLEIRK